MLICPRGGGETIRDEMRGGNWGERKLGGGFGGDMEEECWSKEGSMDERSDERVREE